MEASIKIETAPSAADQRASVAPEGYFFVRNEAISTKDNYANGVQVVQRLGPEFHVSVLTFGDDGEALPLGEAIALYKKSPEKRGAFGAIRDYLGSLALTTSR